MEQEVWGLARRTRQEAEESRRPLTPPPRPLRREEIEPSKRTLRAPEPQMPRSREGTAAPLALLPPSSVRPYLAGFVELLFQPRHRHRDGAAAGAAGPRTRPGHAAAMRWGSGRRGRSPRGWAPPGRPPTATATATAAVTRAHTRARRWQHCVPKPMRSPLAKPRRYANEAAGAAHASLLRGDPGGLELRRKWACEAGRRGHVPGSREQSHKGLSAGRETGCIWP